MFELLIGSRVEFLQRTELEVFEDVLALGVNSSDCHFRNLVHGPSFALQLAVLLVAAEDEVQNFKELPPNLSKRDKEKHEQHEEEVEKSDAVAKSHEEMVFMNKGTNPVFEHVYLFNIVFAENVAVGINKDGYNHVQHYSNSVKVDGVQGHVLVEGSGLLQELNQEHLVHPVDHEVVEASKWVQDWHA